MLFSKEDLTLRVLIYSLEKCVLKDGFKDVCEIFVKIAEKHS